MSWKDMAEVTRDISMLLLLLCILVLVFFLVLPIILYPLSKWFHYWGFAL